MKILRVLLCLVICWGIVDNASSCKRNPKELFRQDQGVLRNFVKAYAIQVVTNNGKADFKPVSDKFGKINKKWPKDSDYSKRLHSTFLDAKLIKLALPTDGLNYDSDKEFRATMSFCNNLYQRYKQAKPYNGRVEILRALAFLLKDPDLIAESATLEDNPEEFSKGYDEEEEEEENEEEDEQEGLSEIVDGVYTVDGTDPDVCERFHKDEKKLLQVIKKFSKQVTSIYGYNPKKINKRYLAFIKTSKEVKNRTRDTAQRNKLCHHCNRTEFLYDMLQKKSLEQKDIDCLKREYKDMKNVGDSFVNGEYTFYGKEEMRRAYQLLSDNPKRFVNKGDEEELPKTSCLRCF